MANKKASKKDILVNARNRETNVHFKTKMKTQIKKAVISIEEKTENRNEILKEALRVIDKTAAKGIIKKNNAARKKSRLMLAFNKTLAAKAN